jgi:putative Mn2+ efflux pump MntP
MDFPSILILSVGLAMDATAASATCGFSAARIRLRDYAACALLFGGFQAGMPLVGWGLTYRIGPVVQAWDHWIAFALLFAIGGKMLYEALRHADDGDLESKPNPFRWRLLLTLAVATSIDALAVGVALPLMNAPVALSICTIGVTTALLSIAGLQAGRRLGAAIGKRFDVVGGLVLIGIGTKILIEHLSAMP